MSLSKEGLKKFIFEEYVGNDPTDRGLRPKTVKNRRNCLRRFYRFLGDKPFCAETCRDWMRSLHKKGNEESSIRQTGRILKATASFLYKRKVVDYDFSKEIPLPKIYKKSLEVVPAELAEKIIIAGTKAGKGDNCINKKRKKEHRQALRFILRTGLRNRELRDLRGKDVNLEEETFLVRSKSGNIDVLPIPRDMLGELRKRKDKLQLFEVTAGTLNRSLKRGCKRLGISTKVRTHTLRHIFCTSLLKCGVPIQIVSRLMRHASVTLTDSVYSHYQIDDLRLALNGSHPLIAKGLEVREVFSTIQKLIESTGIKEDERFIVKLEQKKGNLMVKIEVK